MLLAVLLTVASYPGRAAEPIVLTLRAAATVSAAQVTVGDVASLEGGDAQRREQLARLDLTELPLTSQPVLVSQQQIDFRLRLAGFDEHVFRLEGPHYVRVSRPTSEALDNKIAATAKQALEQKLPALDEVAIQFNQPVRLPPLPANGEDIHLEAEVRSPIVVPGRILVEVGIYIRGARRFAQPVYLDVKKLQSAPVALRRIEAGEVFGPENFRLERVALDDNQKAGVAADSLVGRRARRTVAAGRILEPDDLEPDTAAAAVIHQRDLVHLVAKVGPLQVKARGEALQEGRIGQLIQVRNIDSSATVTGRVLDRSTVEVEY
jgi:flagella basal body P-ring formation protein FlgA